MSWAAFPTAWMQSKVPAGEDKQHPLASLRWQDHAGTGIAALMLLMLLSVKLNMENHKRLKVDNTAPRSSRARMSFDEMQHTTGFHRKTIGKAISLLEALGALTVEVNGRANVYVLSDVLRAGGWRRLPVESLFRGKTFILREMPRKKTSLNALKLYLVLLHLFNNQTHTTAVSYTAITRWSGIRREDIAVSLDILFGYKLVRPSYERDFRHSAKGDNDQSQRYYVNGLSGRRGSTQQQSEEDAEAAQQSPQAMPLEG
jgi:hypothetical protein